MKELQTPIIRPRYRIPFSSKDIESLLQSAFQREVEFRGRKIEFDNSTKLAIQMVAQWLTREKGKPMLMLCGGVGNGKTTMLKAVKRMMAQLSSSAKSQSAFDLNKEESNVLYSLQASIYVPVILTAQEIADFASTDKEKFQQVGKCKFLMIDDLGIEPPAVKNYGTEITPVTDILYQRYDNLFPTMVTTNLKWSEIEDAYNLRISDRFNEIFDSIGYLNKSYRC